MQENLSAAVDPPRTRLRELTVLPETPELVGGAGCLVPKDPTPLSALWAVLKIYPEIIFPEHFETTACLFPLIRIWLCCLQCFDAVGWAAGRASGL